MQQAATRWKAGGTGSVPVCRMHYNRWHHWAGRADGRGQPDGAKLAALDKAKAVMRKWAEEAEEVIDLCCDTD